MDGDNFKGIWIPKELWTVGELSLQEKVFLVELKALDNENGCFATNDYFSEFFQLSKCRCSNIVKGLEKRGYIAVEYHRKRGKALIDRRVIKLTDKSRVMLKTNHLSAETKPDISKSKSDISEIITGYFENEITGFEKYKDINIINNIKDNMRDILNILLKGEGEKELPSDCEKTGINQFIEERKVSDRLKDTLKSYAQYCSEKGREIVSQETIRGIIGQIGKRYSDEEHLIESLETAVCGQYQSVFPIKRRLGETKKNISRADVKESYAARKLRELEEAERDGRQGISAGYNNY